jgi:microcin C transport system substrate-binding protein
VAAEAVELQILDKFRGQIPDAVFTTEYDPPKYDGSGNIRDGIREALRLLKEASWSFRGEKLVNDQTGQPFEFEILLDDPQVERITLPFVQNLARIGVTAHVRTVDTAQYQRRLDTFDFDMVVVVFPQSLSPGNEQREFFGSPAADAQGSRNVLGIKSPPIDELIEDLIKAPTRESLVAHVHALDRVLQYGYYVIPHFHLGAFWVAYWDKFQRPQIAPKYALDLNAWWIDPQAERQVEQKKQETGK